MPCESLDRVVAIVGGLMLAFARPDAAGPALLLGAAVAWGRPGRWWTDAAAVVIWQVGWLSWFSATWERFGAASTPAWMFPLLIGVQAAPLVVTATAARALTARIGPLGGWAAWTLGLAAAGTWQPIPTAPALAVVDVPLAAAWVAWLGRDAAAAAVFAWGAAVWRRPRVAGVAMALAIGAGAAAPRSAPGPGRVALVQPNTGSFDGRRASTAPARAARLVATLQAADADWIVTSEGAWPLASAWPVLETPVLLGASPGRPPSNALVVVSRGVARDRYEKHDLVPVAERVWMGLGHDRYRAGTGPRLVGIGDQRVGALICYEDLLAHAVHDAHDADWIVVASNDTWLGGGHGNAFHLAASRLVALETGRPVIRPTTSGTSAVIAPDGRLSGVIGWVDGDAGETLSIGAQVALPRAAPRPATRAWLQLLAVALVGVGLAVRPRVSGS